MTHISCWAGERQPQLPCYPGYFKFYMWKFGPRDGSNAAFSYNFTYFLFLKYQAQGRGGGATATLALPPGYAPELNFHGYNEQAPTHKYTMDSQICDRDLILNIVCTNISKQRSWSWCTSWGYIVMHIERFTSTNALCILLNGCNIFIFCVILWMIESFMHT